MLHWLHFIQWTGFVIYGLLHTGENMIRVSNGGSVSISIRILQLFFNSKQNCRYPCRPIFLNFSCRDMWSWPWAHSRECELKSWMILLGVLKVSCAFSVLFCHFLSRFGGRGYNFKVRAISENSWQMSRPSWAWIPERLRGASLWQAGAPRSDGSVRLKYILSF